MGCVGALSDAVGVVLGREVPSFGSIGASNSDAIHRKQATATPHDVAKLERGNQVHVGMRSVESVDRYCLLTDSDIVFPENTATIGGEVIAELPSDII